VEERNSNVALKARQVPEECGKKKRKKERKRQYVIHDVDASWSLGGEYIDVNIQKDIS